MFFFVVCLLSVPIFGGASSIPGGYMLHRFKRTNFDSGPPILEGDCVSKCLTMMTDAVKKSIPSFGDVDKKSSDPSSLFTNTSESLFDKFCTQIYRPVSTCVYKCPRDSLTDLLTKSISFLDYVCISNYDGVKRNYPCLKNSFDTSIKSSCKSEYNQLTIIQARNDAEMDAKQKNRQEKLTVADDECKAAVAFVNCNQKTAKNLCNTESATIVKDMYAKSLDSTEHILQYLNVTIPASCNQLKSDVTGGTTPVASGTTVKPGPVEATTKAATSIKSDFKLFVLLFVSLILYRIF